MFQVTPKKSGWAAVDKHLQNKTQRVTLIVTFFPKQPVAKKKKNNVIHHVLFSHTFTVTIFNCLPAKRQPVTYTNPLIKKCFIVENLLNEQDTKKPLLSLCPFPSETVFMEFPIGSVKGFLTSPFTLQV